jgi:hypothetical protein
MGGEVSDWIWSAAMLLFGLYTFSVGTTVDTTKWSPSMQAYWWGFTHPFGPPAPPWWDDASRKEWFDRNGKPWGSS